MFEDFVSESLTHLQRSYLGRLACELAGSTGDITIDRVFAIRDQVRESIQVKACTST